MSDLRIFCFGFTVFSALAQMAEWCGVKDYDLPRVVQTGIVWGATWVVVLGRSRANA